MYPPLTELLRQDGIAVKKNKCQCFSPEHDDKNPSMSISDKVDGGVFKCHSCGIQGNHITYLKDYASPALRARWQAGGFGDSKHKSAEPKEVKPRALPKSAVGTWLYHNERGEVIGAKCRFKKGDGAKSYANYTARGELFVPKTPARSVLWQLPKILASDCPVVVVEGEKCAEAAQAVLGEEFIVTCWRDGTSGVSKSDGGFGKRAAVNIVEVAPLKGRAVILWADADSVGILAMQQFARRIHKLAAKVFMIDAAWLKDNAPAKWDVADAIVDGWTGKQIAAFMRKRALVPEIQDIAELKPPQDERVDAVDYTLNVNGGKHFKILGHESEQVVFQIVKSGEIIKRKYEALHSESVLLITLCDDYFWWLSLFNDDCRKLTASRRISIAGAMRAVAIDKGQYASDRECGVGVWRHDKQYIINVGSKVIELPGGKSSSLAEISNEQTIFHIGARQRLAAQGEHSQLTRLFDALLKYRWRSVLDGYMFCGWLCAAAVGGALKYRPHVWLSGEYGTGKSYLIDEVARRFFSKWGVSILPGTTISGLRRLMKLTSCPVIFDEAEARGRNAELLRDEISAIMKCASSGEGVIVHGAARGEGVVKYSPRSCFLLSSIVQSSLDSATSSRITSLELSAKPVDDWDAVRTSIERALDDAPAMLSYLLYSTEQIVAAADYGYRFFLEKGKTTRQSFQLGTLLGVGAWAKTGEVSGDAIEDELIYFNDDRLPKSEMRTEGSRLLDVLLHLEVAKTKDDVAPKTLLEASVSGAIELTKLAEAIGLRVRYDGKRLTGIEINCSQHNSRLASLLAKTDYAHADLYSVLARLPNAIADNQNRANFAGKRTRRAVYLSKDALLELCGIDLDEMAEMNTYGSPTSSSLSVVDEIGYG